MIDEKKMEMLEARFLKNPKSILFARLADYYLQQGKVDEAVKLCKEGVKYHPYYITGNFILGKAYIAANEFEKAEEELKKVLSYDRQHLAAHGLLAEIMLKLGWENKAVVHYKEILKIDPLNDSVREKLNKLTNYEIEHEEPPPIVSDAEEDTLSSGEKTQPLPEEKPWMKKLEEAFPKSFPEESETPASSEEMSLESLISEAEAFINEKKKKQTHREPTDSIQESTTEKPSAENRTGEPVEQEAIDNAFPDEEEKEQVSMTQEEDLFEELTQDKQQETIKDEEFFEPTGPEPTHEEPPGKKEEKEEVFFEPLEPEFEQGVTQGEQPETTKEEDFFESLPLTSAGEKSSETTETKQEPSEEEILFEPLLPEPEEPPREKRHKPRKRIPEEKLEKHKKESAAIQEKEIREELETEETGFFFEVTEPEPPKKESVEKFEIPEYEKSELTEKEEAAGQKEPEIPQLTEEPEKRESPEPETKKEETPEESKQKPVKEEEKDKKKAKIMSPTLGEIYAAQGQYEKAIKVYENLLEKNPDNKQYQDKIDNLKKKLREGK